MIKSSVITAVAWLVAGIGIVAGIFLGYSTSTYIAGRIIDEFGVTAMLTTWVSSVFLAFFIGVCGTIVSHLERIGNTCSFILKAQFEDDLNDEEQSDETERETERETPADKLGGIVLGSKR